jgi:hypothetical protein
LTFHRIFANLFNSLCLMDLFLFTLRLERRKQSTSTREETTVPHRCRMSKARRRKLAKEKGGDNSLSGGTVLASLVWVVIFLAWIHSCSRTSEQKTGTPDVQVPVEASVGR